MELKTVGGANALSVPHGEVDGGCREAQGRILQELSAEDRGAAHVLGTGGQREVSTSQALQGAHWDPPLSPPSP